jgi:hypothetical protein
MSTIFIQIASYRDPQLIVTIEDCIQNAKYPDNLRFGICNQTDNSNELEKYEEDIRFKIMYVPYEKSNGACWARYNIQQKYYNNETYTLQLDSHHRFVKNWDEKLINMLLNLQKDGYKKPLITSYAPSFNPFNDPMERKQEIWNMNFDRFIPEGVVFFMPAEITDKIKLERPLPARFFSAHFAFTLGQMCIEVPHDPEYYFHGEEISIAVRAYTHGYDLFHPNEIILWHEYTREYRTKHWDDHAEWVQSNAYCHKRNRILFGMELDTEQIDFGKWGFGTNRTVEEYEQYAGISFKNRSVQRYTLENKFPPNPADSEWVSEFKYFIDVEKSLFPELDYDFWCIAFHDKDENTVYRHDATSEEINILLSSNDTIIKILRSFQTNILPSYWIIWSHSISKGWGCMIKRYISYN